MLSNTAHSTSSPIPFDPCRSSRLLRACVVISAVGVFAAAANAAGTKYQVTILQSDGTTAAPNTDANLVYPWGLAASPTGPWWIADNQTGVSTVADSAGVSVPIVVSIPGAGGPGAPTGIVFNPTTDFE